MKFQLPVAPKALAAALSVSVFLTGCASFEQQAPVSSREAFKLTVLHTNDHHGRFWQNNRGEWGMAAQKTLIDGIRAEVAEQGGHVLLLSGGDVNTGVPESDLQDAVPDFLGMNLLGYDAMVLGNHEFDNPMETLRMQEEISDFPFLGANIYYEGTDEHLFNPYEFFTFDDLTVAVMGLTTEDTGHLVMAENIEGVEFRNAIDEAATLVPQLSEKADIVIANTHMGYYEDANHGSNAPGDVTMARTVDGIDIIVGGHSHDPLPEPDFQNNTWIIQAKEWGKYIGRADFEYTDGELTLVSSELIPVNHRDDEVQYEHNAEMLELLSPYQERGEALVNEVIGEVDGELVGDRDVVRFGYSNLGTLMVKAQMERAEADFGLINSGGIRSGIEAGEITYRDVLIVQPFSNQLAYVDLTGAEILDYLDVVALKQVDSGAFAHWYGVEMTIDSEAETVTDIRIQGEEVDLDKTYRMSFNNFSAGGGDDYPILNTHATYVDTGFTDAVVLKDYLEQSSPVRIADYEPKGVTLL